jgi:hypothetical protein
LCDVIDCLLEKKPGRRFASAKRVRERLVSLLSRAQRDGLGRRRFAPIRRKRLRGRAFWDAAAALLLGVLVIGALWPWPRSWPRVSEWQDLHEHVSDAVTPRSEREFARDWAESDRSVGRSKTTTSFIHVGDAWNRELEALIRSLTDLEARENPKATTEGEKNETADRQDVCGVRGVGRCRMVGREHCERAGRAAQGGRQADKTEWKVSAEEAHQVAEDREQVEADAWQAAEEARKAAVDAANQAREIQLQVAEPIVAGLHVGNGVSAKIRKAAEELRDAKGDDAQEKANSKLRDLLGQYFAEDMTHRQKELDSIEARRQKLHAQLDRRRARKQDIPYAASNETS